MDTNLFNMIHQYAQNREIDYASAKALAEHYGTHFKNMDSLVEFKNIVDTYLQSYNANDYAVVESYLFD